MKEQWKPVVGYEGLYSVSNMGRVRSEHSGRCLAQYPAWTGYLQVSLSRNGKGRLRRVHRLVLEAFIGPCPTRHETAHLDGNRTNNVLSNLVWATKQTNWAHKRMHGTAVVGERVVTAKLKAEQVLEIRRLAKSGVPRKQLERQFGVEKTTIRRIINGTAWVDCTPAGAP